MKGNYWGGGKIARKIIRIIYACDIPLGSDKIGKDLFLAHNGLGIVISSEVKIGDNCKIYQNVTLGAGKDGYSEIGMSIPGGFTPLFQRLETGVLI